MKGSELYDKSLLERRFKELKRTPSVKFLEFLEFIDNAEMDELLNKKEYDELKKKCGEEIRTVEEYEEMKLLAKVIDTICKNLHKEFYKAYIEKKARETIK